MRTLLSIALLLLVFAASCAIPMAKAAAAESSGFLSWAFDKSNECDRAWHRIAAVSGTESAPSPADGTGTLLTWPSLGNPTVAPGKMSHNIMLSGPFIHAVSDDGRSAFLPLTARKRGGAARGAQVLENPADAQLEVPYDIKRPLNSSIQQKNFFGTFGENTLPRINVLGRSIRKDMRLFDGTVTRPAFRVDRPRIL